LINPKIPLIYEGLTQYYGNVLAARSGLWTPEQYDDTLVQAVASLDHTPGRRWRPLIDTTVAAQLLSRLQRPSTAIHRGGSGALPGLSQRFQRPRLPRCPVIDSTSHADCSG
jgi:M61 glycyl aminopeptidase